MNEGNLMNDNLDLLDDEQIRAYAKEAQVLICDLTAQIVQRDAAAHRLEQVIRADPDLPILMGWE